VDSIRKLFDNSCRAHRKPAACRTGIIWGATSRSAAPLEAICRDTRSHSCRHPGHRP
jgi:hypothetical protein